MEALTPTGGLLRDLLPLRSQQNLCGRSSVLQLPLSDGQKLYGTKDISPSTSSPFGLHTLTGSLQEKEQRDGVPMLPPSAAFTGLQWNQELTCSFTAYTAPWFGD